jgi:hypothetical protein
MTDDSPKSSLLLNFLNDIKVFAGHIVEMPKNVKRIRQPGERLRLALTKPKKGRYDSSQCPQDEFYQHHIQVGWAVPTWSAGERDLAPWWAQPTLRE